MSAITTTATFQPISQKMRLGSARRSSSVSSSFQRGHAAKITASSPMMKKVGVKLYRVIFLNSFWIWKRGDIFPSSSLKGSARARREGVRSFILLPLLERADLSSGITA